ncbi:MAG: translation initiation factor 2 [Candidatus Sedimenticola endophacoides]
MADDPKKIVVEVVARLGRETQLHLDERHKHFQFTNIILLAVSAVLVVVAVFNVYNIHILYRNLSGIVNNMDSMHSNLKGITRNMVNITHEMETIEAHMQEMDTITTHTAELADTMPRVRGSMEHMTGTVDVIEQDMALLGAGMTNIDQRIVQMTGGVAVMRENVRQIARPMGFMNPMMP